MKILFICTGNTCRSAMAEGIAKKIIDDNKLDIEVSSAGICADGFSKATSNAVNALQKYGIDISRHVSTPLSTEMINEADTVYTMTSAHLTMLVNADKASADKARLLDPDGGDISDPYGGDEYIYEACAERIYQCLKKRLLNTHE